MNLNLTFQGRNLCGGAKSGSKIKTEQDMDNREKGKRKSR